VAALPAELRCLTDSTPRPGVSFSTGTGLVCIASGIGPGNAGRAAEHLFPYGIKMLISWGTAGAIRQDLRSGDLILPESVQAKDGTVFYTDRDCMDVLRGLMKNELGTVHKWPLLEVDKIITTTADKQELAWQTGACAVDMESGELARLAKTHNIPFIVIRAVVDEARDILPPAIINNVDEYGKPRPLALLSEFFLKPGLIRAMFRLSSAMKSATLTLRKVAIKTDHLTRIMDMA